jgi:hypothetical protein
MASSILSVVVMRSNKITTLTQKTLCSKRPGDIPLDGPITTLEIENNNNTIPVLVDESYYEFAGSGGSSANERHIIPPNHIVTRHVKKVIKMHEKSMNAFVFILNETESEVVDFYITTENGIDDVVDVKQRDPLTRTCKDDIISFIHQFKLCP